ncbi:hypothetical protein CDAR_478351 [Caerostris darwini]|uniref:Uncharacterized protein n=1 Tax=Caerostris darwini TaxID=1538125 RepID=A0AAV4PQG4_9ARAC|nr:hypothetical protein CDAR_478351 [Caerostris darwini]
MEYQLDQQRIRKIELMLDCIPIYEELVETFYGLSRSDNAILYDLVEGDIEDYDRQHHTVSQCIQDVLMVMDYGQTLIDSLTTVAPETVDNLQERLSHGRFRLLVCNTALTFWIGTIKYKLQNPQ